jgi:hypothetical protein
MLGRFKIAGAAAIFCLALALVACDAKGDEKTPTPAGGGSAAGPISASPNPCKLSTTTGVCTATITWNTGNGAAAEVTVQDSSGPENVFGQGPTGTQAAPWIAPAPHQYTFRLYDTTKSPRQMVGSVVVKGE